MADSRRVYIGNLPVNTRIGDIEQFIRNCGKYADINYKTNSKYAFIQFVKKSDAQNAVRRLNRKKLFGKPVSVEITRFAPKNKRLQSVRRSRSKSRTRTPPNRSRGPEDYIQYEEEQGNAEHDFRSYDKEPHRSNIELHRSLEASDTNLRNFLPSLLNVPVMVSLPNDDRYDLPIEMRDFPDPRDMHQVYIDDNYNVVDEINERESESRSIRYERQGSPSSSPSYTRLSLRSSPHMQHKNRDRIPSSSEASRKRNRCSEEPEIYDVSKDGKESVSLSRWMIYCKILAERLDKMSEKQQAFARLKIEEAMYEAEFGPPPQQGVASQNAPFTGTLYPVGFVSTQ